MGYKELYGKNFSKKLKELRNKAHLTQKQLAEAANMSIESIQKYEQGRSIPDTNNLFTICDFFKCDIDYLFGLYDAHERSVQEIIDIVGLSETAVNILNSYNGLANNTAAVLQECTPIDRKLIDNQGAFFRDERDTPCSIEQIEQINKDYLTVISQIIETDITATIYKYLHWDFDNSDLTEPYRIKPGDIAARILLDRMKMLLDEIKSRKIISIEKLNTN